MARKSKTKKKGCFKKRKGKKSRKSSKKPAFATMITVIEGPNDTVPIQTQGSPLPKTVLTPPTPLVRKVEYINMQDTNKAIMRSPEIIIAANHRRKKQGVKLTGVAKKKYMDKPFTVSEQLEHLKSSGHSS